MIIIRYYYRYVGISYTFFLYILYIYKPLAAK